jgi:hypothetical protein
VILSFGLLVFSLAVVYCSIRIPGNERVDVVVDGVAGNFSGSLFTILHISNGGRGK